MDDPKRSAVKFPEKKIKTYMALLLFLAKMRYSRAGMRRQQENPGQSDVLQRANEGSEENCRRTQKVKLVRSLLMPAVVAAGAVGFSEWRRCYW
jgi:hypothetical protein